MPRAGNTIRGLLIDNAYSGVFLDGPNATNKRIVGNWIGFNRDNSLPPRGLAGVWLNNGAHDNFVGTPDLADRNVIGNSDKAVYSYGAGHRRQHHPEQRRCASSRTAHGASARPASTTTSAPRTRWLAAAELNEGNVIGPNC